MNKSLKRIFLALLTALLLFSAGLAVAQEQPIPAKVELLSDGIHHASPSSIVQPVHRGLAEDLISGFESFSDLIDISAYQMTVDDFGDFYYSFLTMRPEYFYVDGMYWYYHDGQGHVTSIIPQYKYTTAEIEAYQATYNVALAEALAYTRQASTPIGMLLRASDYLCANYSYDHSLTNRSVEIFFTEKSGVCQAFTQAYCAILNELGFEHTITLSDAMNHVWNMVYLDGEWYHIDVTWNDPNWNGQDIPMSVNHSSFMLSDAGITASGHYEWDAAMTATSTKYDDYFWQQINQAAAMSGDKVYYVLNDYETLDRYVYVYDLANGTSEKVYTYSNGYYSYYKKYHPLWVKGDTLYYGLRDTLYAVPLSGGEAEVVYSTGDSGDWLWYPFAYGNELRIYSASSPGDTTGTVHSVPFKIDYTLELQHLLQMTEGETTQLTATLTPAGPGSIQWFSSNPEVVLVDDNGYVQAVGTGTALVSASYGDDASDQCLVIVHSDEILTLPENTVSIDASAFSGIAAEEIVLPDGLQSIGFQTFANNEQLRLVTITGTETEIAEDAFENCPDVTILTSADSTAVAFAQAYGIAFIILD